ncbi:MAG: branched-chain amino acid ABC transporter permease [Salinisphaera sp.]|jgi:branched-chain amino acid transport system permease protein|nr:branched-chain amino acid ABC transporter permease [Salinisphaera sp.]
MKRYLLSIRFWLVLLVIVVLGLLPFELSYYFLGVLTTAYLFSGYAMSWDLLFGYSGEVNFGPTFLIGLGAYGSALLDVYAGLPMWLCVILGALIAVAGGLLLVAPALRLRGPYFGLITLVAALILEKLIVIFASVTGGEIGLGVPDILSLSTWVNYYDAYVFMLASGLIMVLVSRSSIGLILEASGQDPIATQALGLNIIKYKLVAFVLSAFISGMAGSLTVFYLGTASVGTVIAVSVTLQIIIATVLGGRRSIIGPALGAIFLIVAAELLRPIGQLNEVVVAVLALLVLLFYPDGFIGLFKGRGRGL